MIPLLLKLLLLFFSFLFLRINSQRVESQLKYIPPQYPVFNPNITTGSVFVMSYNDNETSLASPDVLHSLGTACAMSGYNEGKLQELFKFNVKITFNMDSFSINFADNRTGYNFMQLLESDLVHISNGSSIGQSYIKSIGAILGNAITMQFTNYVPYFAGVQIPSISYGFSSFSEVYYTTSTAVRTIGKSSYYDISAPTGSNFVLAGTQFLRTLNWTLVAPIFSRDSYGFYGERYLQSTIVNGKVISSVCSFSIPLSLDVPGAQAELETFVSCIANVDTLSVVWLWMNAYTAYNVIKWLRDRGLSNLNFVTYAEQSEDLVKASRADPEILENVIVFSDYVSPLTKNVFESCVPNLSEDTYVGKLGRFVDQCIKNGTGEFPNCNLNNPEEVCTCDKNLSDVYKYGLDYFAYAFDAVGVIANAVSLIQNNCSYLTEYVKKLNGTETIDYCALTTFDPPTLGKAMKAVNFTGLSGPVSFTLDRVTRVTADLIVKQFNSNLTLVDVGLFINGKLYLNTSKLTFKNGKIPISEIVVQIPDFGYWFVDVFFGITCFLLVADFLIWAIITYYRNDKYMKRCSPFFMALMTVGICQVLVSNILLSAGLNSSAMCILTNFFLLSGLSFIVANILAKNYRVYRIFSNVKARALKMNDKTLFVFTVVIAGTTWTMWGITSFADGPIKVFTYRGVDNPFYIYGLCRVTSQWFQDFQIIFWYVYFVSLFLLTGFLGFLTRNVNDIFNESVNITIVAFGYIAFAIIFAPLYYIQSNTTNSNSIRWAIQALSVCFLSGMTMSLLHLPTLWRFFKIKRRASRRGYETEQ